MRYEVYTSSAPQAAEAAGEVAGQISFEPSTVLFLPRMIILNFLRRNLNRDFQMQKCSGLLPPPCLRKAVQRMAA